MKIFLPISRSLLKLAQHLGIAVNDIVGEKEISTQAWWKSYNN
jgi:hypothetical protein